MATIRKIGFIGWFSFLPFLIWGQSPSFNTEQWLLMFANEKADSILMDSLKTQIKLLEADEAIECWTTFSNYFETINDRYGIGFCNYNMSILLKNQGEYIKSHTALQKSLENFEKIDNNWGIACSFAGFGELHNRLNNYIESLEYLTKSAELFHKMNSRLNEAKVYLNLGATEAKQNNLAEAKKHLLHAIEIFKKTNQTNDLISCYINLGEVFEKTGNSDSALYYFQTSLHLSSLVGSATDSVYSNYYLGNLYLNTNRLSQAKLHLETAYKLASEIDEKTPLPKDDMAHITGSLSQLFSLTGDSAKAFSYLKKKQDLEIENNQQESNKELDRIKLLEMENQSLLERKKRMQFIQIGMVVFLLSVLFTISLYKSYLHKRKANRLLTEMDELKTRMFSNITHELRTPLTLILGPLEKMLATDAGEKTNRKQVKTMRKNTRSLLNLVNEMLELAKIDAKSLKLEMQSGDIAKFIRTRFAVFATMAQQKQIDFQTEVSETKIITFFDASKLEKIINNLLSNAVKFTPKNGKIQSNAIFHHDKKNTLEIIIEDTGRGIPADELAKIFDRFHQAENSQTVITPGTGIGLSLTNELVTLMHGHIEVESESGKGSRFRVLLPLGIEHLKKEEYHLQEKEQNNESTILLDEDSPEDEPEVTGTKKINAKNFSKVLVAEDQDEIREFILENLRDNFSVIEANNGTVAYQKAVETIPDLVVTDLMMPEMDGNELCKKLKTDERTSHIPVIILTGKSGLKDKIKGLESGADAYLTKPFSIKELRLRISKLIEQRQKLRERFTRNLNLEPKDIAVTSADEKFLTRALEVIEKNMGDSEFEVTQFQEKMLMSRMQLFRKIKALTNQTPGEFIRTIRLKRAAKLIEQNFGNIAQITYEVGFNNPSYFAKCFKDLFEKLPSEYQEKA